MSANDAFSIAVLPGDGIGQEITAAALRVLDTLERKFGGFKLEQVHIEAGAEFYQKSGVAITDEDFKRTGDADAIFLGAMGLPDVRYPDGTEIAPHLDMRVAYGLFAGVRPVKAYPNAPLPLADPKAKDIDMIVLRESTEGLFASRGIGSVENDQRATDTMVITRDVCERLFDHAFKLARRRKRKGGKGMVTCVDKSNVFVSYAFFRQIFDEVASRNTDISAGYSYVDAMALDMVRKPWEFDVLVAENMFADILSDLGGGIVGGMGMASCAEIGAEHALFQPAHGSAPDIAGQDKANPTATLLATAMMLEWLGERAGNEACLSAAKALEDGIETGFAERTLRPMEFGGPDGTKAYTDKLIGQLNG
ncbi:MAG: isocitrate/isopropylmalate family dehydrogenase [Rhodospirillales bacterium]|nr:isocitrate/isopropylmalate family dehydrogenase [Rhodospirillales bacterium]